MARLLGPLALVLSPICVLTLVRVGGIPIRTMTWACAAFLVGVLLELLRLTRSVRDTAWIATGAFGLSLFNFLPYRSEADYSFHDHLDGWPIAFVVLLLLAMVVLHPRRLTARLGEGNAMLYSIAFFYWMLDRYAHESAGLLPVVLATLPLAYTAAHLLTELPLSRGVRLALSLWSAVVMGAIGLRYAFAVARLGSVEDRLATADIEGAALIFAEFLLLGAAGAAIARNLMMLFGYFPGRDRFFNRKYFKEVRELSRAHVERFSSDQVPHGQAGATMIAAGLLLVADWNVAVISTGFAIWMILAGVPWVMDALAWWRAMRRADGRATDVAGRQAPR